VRTTETSLTDDAAMTNLSRRLLTSLVIGVGVTIATLAASRAPLPTDSSISLAELRRAFAAPPDDARIMMRWWWFGPAVTEAELDRELRAMKDAGIGGFEVQPVYPVALDEAASASPVRPFLSPAFLDALRFVSTRAHDLGLRMDLTLGSGWPYGGPQVSIDRAAGKLRVERIKLTAGTRRVPVPDIGAGERLIAAFLVEQATGQDRPAPSAQRTREVTDIADGVARIPDGIDAGSGSELLFFISSRSGMMVKRPSVDAEGFVLNHYDSDAAKHYLADVGAPLLRALGPNPPYAIFCDSLEVYESDWTPEFLHEFSRRRGYDLRPHLPALVIDSGPQTGALRHDWGQTLAELLNDQFLTPVREWATAHGTRLRAQAYGIPPATIWSNSLTDLPEGEGVEWRGVSATRWAASAGHLFGRPVISSETWTWLHSPSFRATPLDMKAEADIHFLQGVNQVVGHGWPYSPPEATYPGWRFYAAGAFNDSNPWWVVMPDVARYLQRASFLLRQGQPIQDVAVYLPIDDAWARFEPGKVGSLMEALSQRVGPDLVGRVLEAGFSADFVDDQVVRMESGPASDTLVLGAGRYRVVLLPALERIAPDTLKRLEAFARAGGVVVATRRLPDQAPGFLATPGSHAEVRDTATRLFRAPGAPGVFVEDEKQLAVALLGRLQADVELAPRDADIGFVHRRTSIADVYFVANTSNARKHATATFRTSRMVAERWDLVTGRTAAIEAERVLNRGVSVALDLQPYESCAVVFTDGPAGRVVASSAARKRQAAVPAVDLSSGWTVRFGAAGTPHAVESLRSWTDDAETVDFSGVATYEKTVEVPRAMVRPGLTVRLDLGESRALPPAPPPARLQAWLDAPVREAAVVFVNGRRAGSVWCPPYAVDVTALIRPGQNQVRIEVGNLAMNRMAARALPDYRLLNRRYGTRFEPQDMDKVRPVTSGLVGKITLVARQD